jgi:hypothetical protein
MPDVLDSALTVIEERIAELRPSVEEFDRLRPLVDEFNRLQSASSALGEIPVSTNGASSTSAVAAAAPTARATTGTSRGSIKLKTPSKPTVVAKPKATAKAKTRRSKASKSATGGRSARSAESLRIITESPGLAIPELAKRMGIKDNYLYRVLPALAKDGHIVKRDRAWYPTGSETNAA